MWRLLTEADGQRLTSQGQICLAGVAINPLKRRKTWADGSSWARNVVVIRKIGLWFCINILFTEKNVTETDTTLEIHSSPWHGENYRSWSVLLCHLPGMVWNDSYKEWWTVCTERFFLCNCLRCLTSWLIYITNSFIHAIVFQHDTG